MGAKSSSSTLCLNELNSKKKFLSNPLFLPFRFPLFLTFHFYKVYDKFIYAKLSRWGLTRVKSN